ncbi:RNA polymerase sigma factor [Inediibacterium massiliense]|uniref:RNA polymerase sigma factor n=1 Tax=Inediibacterium massiliense TaxID=1658111 RepID=UPI0006B473B9|nr:RNA polymerase sigma factor [Inediibacterium massiliense]
MDVVSDEDLFKQVQNGRKEAVELIVKRYYKDIFRYIYIKLNDYYTSQDLCQEVFCKVYKRRDTYSSEYPFKPWLYKIAYHCIIDYTRSSQYKKQQKVVPIDTKIKEKKNTIDHALFHNNINDFIEGLNQGQKEVIKLRFCNELSIEDIAQITGSNINTVKSRLYQGIKHIKNKLETGGEVDEAKKNKRNF